MVRSVAARAKLALAFWMLLALCGPARCEGAAGDCGTVGPGVAHEGLGTVGWARCGASHRAFAFGARPLS